ncbi:MAG: RT0821/Lpp0805 family surface protein [Rhodospirillaceae bacterium]
MHKQFYGPKQKQASGLIIRKRMKFVISHFLLASTLTLGGCTTTGTENETFGTLLGAAAGAWAGSSIGSGDGRVVATAVGTMLGASIGNRIGRSMDELDLIKAHEAQEYAYAAPLGERVIWNNPESGNYGNVTSVRDGYTDSGRYCREYQIEVTVGGQKEQGYGTACREENGSWQIVSE